jgi:hypothetical protein
VAKYRSKFESRVAPVMEKAGGVYEGDRITYVTTSTYTPDFVFTNPYGEIIFVECKGYFRPGDTKKYRAIAEEILDIGSVDFVFLLQCPSKPVRKGAKLTMGEWCDKYGIRWFQTPEEVVAYANNR